MTALDASAPAPRRAGLALWRPWTLLSLAAALLVALPIAVILLSPFGTAGQGGDVFGHLSRTVLPRYLGNTGWLMAGVLLIAGSIGVLAAWLIATADFPLRRVLAWALVLPLAMPGYIIAYAYADLLDFDGPVQAGLRALFGWQIGQYWFPELRSLGGAVWMLGLVLYPYVYLLSRAGFAQQSAALMEAGRSLGHGPVSSFLRLALPAARPAIVAGIALALMEAIADYGTVAYFNVPTFTVGIFRTWFGMGERIAAAQLAAILFLFALALIWLERGQRSGRFDAGSAKRNAPMPPRRLSGIKAWAASLACLLPVLFGFLLPVGHLIGLALVDGDPLWGRRFLSFAGNSVLVAGIAALLVGALGLLLAYARRFEASRLNRSLISLAATGYALPGSVIAVGILIPFSGLDNALDGFLRARFGVSSGLLFSGTLFALIFAYAVRFLTAAFNACQAGLERIGPQMDEASRSLGHSRFSTLRHVHLPLMRGAALSALLLVFVDVMKELPATLILRPFNFETLATRVYRLAADERLAEASTAALVIVLLGLVPVLLLNRAMAKAEAVRAS